MDFGLLKQGNKYDQNQFKLDGVGLLVAYYTLHNATPPLCKTYKFAINYVYIVIAFELIKQHKILIYFGFPCN